MKILLLATLSLFLLLAAVPDAGDPPPGSGSLRFPLDVPAALVASFAEYRPDHLHPGADFSTGGRNGLPVRAVAAGRIYRLKVEWRGYGRALYIRHPDGRISVYAHLERYEDRRLGLERRVKEEKRRQGERYPGDIFLDPPLEVARGTVIGYSGESGAGLPHLHFELRREDQEPTDPLQPAWSAGEAPPVFTSVIFQALSPESWIEGRRSLEIPLGPGRDGVFAPDRSVAVTGPFLPEARIESRDSEGHRLGIRALSVRVDGVIVYDLRLESFRFSQYPEVGLLLDHARSSISPPRYTYFLARLRGNDLGGPARREKGWPSLAPGGHRLEVEAAGAAGGSSRAVIPFHVLPGVRPLWEAANPPGSRLTLRFGATRADLGPGLKVIYRAAGRKETLPCAKYAELPDGETCGFELPTGTHGVTAELFLGSASLGRCTFIFPRGSGGENGVTGLRIDPAPRYVDLRLRAGASETPPARLVLRGAGGEEWRFPLAEAEPGEFLAGVPAGFWKEASGLGVEWESSSAPVFQRLAARPHFASALSGLEMSDCGIGLLLPPRSVYEDTPVQCDTAGPVPAAPREMALLGDPVRLLPEGTPLARKGDLLFPLPADPHPERMGIYRLDASRSAWIYEGGEREGGFLRLPVGRLDTFALLRDDSPPRILDVDPSGPDPLASRRPVLRVRIEERGAGLSYDGVHLFLDGTELETEFDPDRGWSVALPAEALSPGRHDGTAWAVDRAGNRSSTVAFELRIR